MECIGLYERDIEVRYLYVYKYLYLCIHIYIDRYRNRVEG